MLGVVQSSKYNTTSGGADITLSVSTSAGQIFTVHQYGDYGDISLPMVGQVCEVVAQSSTNTQVDVLGYYNYVKDPNLVVPAMGEKLQTGLSFYLQNYKSGLWIQKALSTARENLMMGQSTNAVLVDIINVLVAMCAYSTNHIHTNGNGGANTGKATTNVPSSNLPNDLTYIQANNNLATTGYIPK